MVEHSLAPDQYCKLFDLKPNYPTVAPSYAQQRRELALQSAWGGQDAGAPTPKSAEPQAAKPNKPKIPQTSS